MSEDRNDTPEGGAAALPSDPVPGPAAGPRWSTLALVSLVLSVLPVGSVLAPPLGAAALLQLRRRPDLRGAGIAWAGIAVGVVASSLMVGGAWTLWREFSQLSGRPALALRAAWDGDAEAFRGQMSAPGREASAERLREWSAPMRGRLGEFRGLELAPEPPPAPEKPLPDTEMRALYLGRFGAIEGPVRTMVTFERPGAATSVAAIRVRRFEFLLPDGARIVFPPDDEQPAANAATEPAGAR